MDWTHLISALLGLVPFGVNIYLHKKKREGETLKQDSESADILSASNLECYKQLTALRKLFVQQERKLMEFELLAIRYEADNQNDNLSRDGRGDQKPDPENR